MDDENKNDLTVIFTKEVVSSSTVHMNVDQEYISITKDKLKNILNDFEAAIIATQRIGTYTGIVLTLLLALVTSSTKNFFGFSAETWSAIFILLLIYFACRLLLSIMVSIQKRKDRNVDEICRRVMRVQQEKETSFFGKLLKKFHP